MQLYISPMVAKEVLFNTFQELLTTLEKGMTSVSTVANALKKMY